ncbi:hypothetical protein LSH36_343g00001 [Paralvinella palmiformis]|uniref:Cytochrome P450 n=1 Tax=Paralvinella palmiformis TaxID=53620 RepID=A0AAD9JFV1_9ANNE|nr:hypothetical protein LSH36_343g00001 [Paralvinella palmiformis]
MTINNYCANLLLAETGCVTLKKRCMDFLDILLTAKDEDGKGLTFSEVRDEVDTFLFEGHDTTASALAWTVYSLAGHPEYQKKCQMEIDEILNGRETDEITWDDLPKLTYLTQCLKEAMRLHCPVPFISRLLTKEMTIDGKTLPKNSIVDIQLYNMHHNPQIWKNNMVYDPSRFDPDKIENMDSFAFVPFSAGPRNCIGQNFAMHEMKTILARIFRMFDVSLDPNYKVEKRVAIVMKTSNGIRVNLSKRSH